MSAPSLAKCSACDRPCPRAPPVTSTILSLNRCILPSCDVVLPGAHRGGVAAPVAQRGRNRPRPNARPRLIAEAKADVLVIVPGSHDLGEGADRQLSLRG